MSQHKNKTAGDRPVEKTPDSKTTGEAPRWRRTGLILISIFIVVIVSILLFFKYQGEAPFRLTVITVDDTSIRMDYFLKRTELAGADPVSMLLAIVNEQIIKLQAPKYGIEVSPEDITRELMNVARGESEVILESEFQQWYRQLLNETGLSDSEYQDIARTGILAIRLQEYLAERLSTIAEQVHVHNILLETLSDAEEARARWEAGEDFADLAKEVSLDQSSWDNGGDIGWFPRGILDRGLEYAAFNVSVDNVSAPIPVDTGAPTPELDPNPTKIVYYLLMVSERATAREIDEDALETLRSKALEDWLSEEFQFHEVHYHGFTNGFDSETYAWMNWQLEQE
ncbi:peptidylprolyl isomerase [Chloroflexota bacterium]